MLTEHVDVLLRRDKPIATGTHETHFPTFEIICYRGGSLAWETSHSLLSANSSRLMASYSARIRSRLSFSFSNAITASSNISVVILLSFIAANPVPLG